MITDPVYEGKSMQGMIDLTRKGGVPEGSKVLHAHLGGAPASNGYSDHYKADGIKVGGHQASFASMVSISTALCFPSLRP
jgi:hypothetical protein